MESVLVGKAARNQWVLAPERTDGPPLVDLDPLHYKLLAEFEARFPAGPPSLRGAIRTVCA